MKNAKILFTILGLLLLVSVFFNIKPDTKGLWHISQTNANTRPTYNTFHSINDAQMYATGKGIKIGIIDKYFGFKEKRNTYAGGLDFVGNNNDFENIAEHGFWMATTLKEIAPDVEVFALNARSKDRVKERDAIVNAIDWAIDKGIHILTYSADQFQQSDREAIDKAVEKAVDHNIVVIFIHYDLPENILPGPFVSEDQKPYSREVDLSVFHFDYNLLLIDEYLKNVEAAKVNQEGFQDMTYLSFSSMAPVLAGIVALVKEINPNLSVHEIKELLIKSSKEIEYNGYSVKRIVDAKSAIQLLKSNY